MPKASDVYPRRNLPGSAEDWGRRVEGVQKDIDARLERIEQATGLQSSLLEGQIVVAQNNATNISSTTDTVNQAIATPRLPTNITVQSNIGYWLDDGTAKSEVTISFAPVVNDLSGMPIAIEKYELWSSVAGAEKVFNTSSPTTTIVYDGWTPGVEIVFAVQAKSVYGIASGFAQDITITPAYPTAVAPKQPANVAIDSNVGSFLPTNEAVANIIISWDAVTQSVDDEPLLITEYEVWVNDAPYARTTETTFELVAQSLSVNAIRIRAKSSIGTWGDVSEPAVTVTADSPDVAVLVPSAPTLTTGFGIVTVRWDGTYTTPAPNGTGPVFVEIQDGSTWNVAGVLSGPSGSLPIQSAKGSTVVARLVARDVLNRPTGTSDTASIVTEGVDTGDITAGFEEWILAQAGGAKITVSATAPTTANAGDLWFKSTANDQVENIYIYNGTAFVLYTLIADSILVANSITASNLNIGSIWATEAWIDALRVGAISADIITTSSLTSNGDFTIVANAANTAGATASSASNAAKAAQTAADAAGLAAQTAGDAATALTESLNTQQTRFVVTSTGAKVQTADATQTLLMEPGQISIQQNGVNVSTWSGSKLTVPTAVITQAELGGHLIEKYSTGRTTFKALTT